MRQTVDRVRSWVRRARVALVVVPVLVACGGTEPTRENVAGSYSATTFRVEQSGQPTLDLLAEGSTLSVTLTATGTVSGSLAIPASANPDGDVPFTADLAGTYTLAGSTLTFDGDADTFFRDIEFEVDGDRIRGVFDDPDARITLVLTRAN